jgi:chemotaxis protein methyltransferase CheR
VRLDALIAFIEDRTGWTLGRGGVREALERFLASRAAELGMRSPGDYAARAMVDAREYERLVDAVTVTHSWLFRDAHQFDVLERWMVQRGRKELNVWAPGCASGEDAYTLSMLGLGAGIALNVLGSDINLGALSAARRARYDAWSSRDVPPRFRSFLLPRADGTFEISEEARSRVRFEPHNLIEPAVFPQGPGKWDLIVCRNVLIYFAQPRARSVLERLAQTLELEGCLVLGASDLVHEVPAELVPMYTAERLLLLRTARGGIKAKPDRQAHTRAALVPKRPAGPAREPAPGPLDAVADRDLDRLKSGLKEMQLGHLRESLEVFRSVCDSAPLRSEAHLCLGIAHHLAGNSEQALPAFRAALLLDPALWPASYYLALCFENLGYFREAQREFERVLEADKSADAKVDAAGAGPLAELELWHGDLVTLARRRLARNLDGKERR